ncbi:hypothetical protein G7043_04780 [Lentzea sp. NEAU-D13]|uniref:Uncharacterized protein n=1 Tax=Lentzea alba TaxID=2714351 RepID=A0A7C9RN18_9PSEU|nr:hypothetical protein [Lentzea alba]NGY58247.1 hypothetical protein [Lentzea alba]
MTEDPKGLLTELTAMRKRARADRHGYWLPFLLFGLITLGATPFYGPRLCVDSGQDPELVEPRVCSWTSADLPWLYHWLHPTGQMEGPVFGLHQPSIAPDLYWIVALLCGYLAVVWWYRWRAAQVGVETPTRLYAQVTIFMLVLPLIGVPVLSELIFGRLGWQIALPITVVLIVAATWRVRSVRFTLAVLALFALAHFATIYPYGPLFVLAAGLIGLAYLERSAVCTITVVIFTATVLFVNEAGRFGFYWPYPVENFASTALPAFVLLVGGIIGSVRREMAR